MNAINFIKLYGLHSARVTVEDAQENTHYCTETGYHSIKLDVAYEPCPDCVYLSELKRLVDSVDLIDSLGGLELSKKESNDCRFYEYADMSHRAYAIKQAIADYELLFCSGESK